VIIVNVSRGTEPSVGFSGEGVKMASGFVIMIYTLYRCRCRKFLELVVDGRLKNSIIPYSYI
jgi:hypothetical protein